MDHHSKTLSRLVFHHLDNRRLVPGVEIDEEFASAVEEVSGYLNG